MREAEKTNLIRPKSFHEKYLQGRVIDIGAGSNETWGGVSLVCSTAEGFDHLDGDANVISSYRKKEAYDTVHSSHCLEHMHDPHRALLEWWSLVKPDGYLIVVVPDEDLYEQGFFPSIFNKDHKATFRYRKASSWSPVSYDVENLFNSLPGVDLISVEVQDHNYDYSIQRKFGQHRRKLSLLSKRYIKMERMLGYEHAANRVFRKFLHKLGVAIDQTHGNVLCQIQVIAKKRRDGRRASFSTTSGSGAGE